MLNGNCHLFKNINRKRFKNILVEKLSEVVFEKCGHRLENCVSKNYISETNNYWLRKKLKKSKVKCTYFISLLSYIWYNNQSFW